MSTYRCEACKKDVEVERIDILDIIEVTLCEACIEAAEEAVKQESYDEGYQEGWQDAENSAEEKEEDTSIFLQNKEGVEVERKAEDS